MSSAVDELKKSVALPGKAFKKKLNSRLSMTAFAEATNSNVFYLDENVNIFGEQRSIRRLYVRQHGSLFEGVGWIVNEDIDFCMICTRKFGLFLYRHHCRSCGNIVCDNCSSETAVIFEMRELGEQRVCIQCYWGQDPVHASHSKPLSTENSDNEEDDEDGDDDEEYNLSVSLHKVGEDFLPFTSSANPSHNDLNREIDSDESETEDLQNDEDLRLDGNDIDEFCNESTDVSDISPIPQISSDTNDSKPKKAANIDHEGSGRDDAKRARSESQRLRALAVEEAERIREEERLKQAATSAVLKEKAKRHTSLLKVNSDESVNDEVEQARAVQRAMLEEAERIATEKARQREMEQTRKAGDEARAKAKLTEKLEKEQNLAKHLEQQQRMREDAERLALINQRRRQLEEADEHSRAAAAQLAAVTAVGGPAPSGGSAPKYENEKDQSPSAVPVQALEREEQQQQAEKLAQREAEERSRRQQEIDAQQRQAKQKQQEEEEEVKRIKQKQEEQEYEAKRIKQEQEEQAQAAAAEREAGVAALRQRDKQLHLEAFQSEQLEQLKSVEQSHSENEQQQEQLEGAADEDASRRILAVQEQEQEQEQEELLDSDEEAGDEEVEWLVEQQRIVEDARRQAEEIEAQIQAETHAREEATSPTSVTPTPAFVLKTKSGAGEKVFINVCHHTLISRKLVGGGPFFMKLGIPRTTVDKNGEESLVCDAAINTGLYNDSENAVKGAFTLEQLSIGILEAVANELDADLDSDYKLPRIGNNYKGTEVEVMQLARAEQVGAPTVAPVTASTPVPEPAAAPQPASLPAAASAARSRSRTESLDKSSAPQASVTSVRRSSGGGGSMFGFGSSVAARPSDAGETSNPHLPVSPEEQARWSSVLPKGERIVVSGTVGKKNPMGMTQTRQLLITVGAADGPHIRYGDIKSHTLKGEVEYPSKQLPTANVVSGNPSAFEIKTYGRTFKFTDSVYGGKIWVDQVTKYMKK